MSQERQFPQVFAGLLAIGLSLVTCGFFTSQALEKMRPANQVVSVVGSARQSIRSDLAIWRCTISAEETSLSAAYQKLEQTRQQVKTYLLEEKGLPANALTLGELNRSALPELLSNGQPSGRNRGYLLSQTFTLQLPDVEKVQALALDSSELIQRGLAFESHPPEYLYTKLSEMRVEMLAKASQDARTRAEMIISSAGGQLGPVRAARTGVFQITRPHSTEVSDYGSYDTSTIEKDITAVMTIDFAVD